MGLADQLGYRCEAPNAFHRLNRALASSRSGAWLFSKVEHHLDELVDRLSGRRTTFTQAMAGMPVIDVTTVGARSGQPRTSPLVGIPTNGDLAIVGSGWGAGVETDLFKVPALSFAYRSGKCAGVVIWKPVAKCGLDRMKKVLTVEEGYCTRVGWGWGHSA